MVARAWRVAGGADRARSLLLSALAVLLAAALAHPSASHAESAGDDPAPSEQTAEQTGEQDEDDGPGDGTSEVDDGADGDDGADADADDGEGDGSGEPSDGSEHSDPDGDGTDVGEGSGADGDGTDPADGQESVTSLSEPSMLTLSVGGTPPAFTGLVPGRDITHTAPLQVTGATLTFENAGSCPATVSVATSDAIAPFLLRVTFAGTQAGVTALSDGPATVGAGGRSSPAILTVEPGTSVEGLPLTYQLFTSIAGDPDFAALQSPPAGTTTAQLTYTITESSC